MARLGKTNVLHVCGKEYGYGYRYDYQGYGYVRLGTGTYVRKQE